MSFKLISYTALKERSTRLGLSIDYVIEDDVYLLRLSGLTDQFQCRVSRDDPKDPDLIDFEANVLGQQEQIVQDNALQVSFSNATELKVSPKYSNKYTIDTSFTKVDLPRNTSALETIYSYTGSGLLEGFMMEFNSDRVNVRLEVDGYLVFLLDFEDVEDYTANSGWSNFNCSMRWHSDSNQLQFCPQYPIEYSSSVVIKAGANSWSRNRDMKAYSVTLTKES